MPLAAERPDVLSDDRLPALAALGRPALGALRLARHAPRIAVLFDMRHAALKRVAALGAEEVAKVPVVAQRHHVLAHDGSRAVLAPRREQLVPVQVAVEPEARVPVLGHGLARCFGEVLARGPSGDALETRRPVLNRLRRDLERLERRAACVACEALRVEALRHPRQRDEAAFDEVAALVAASRGAAACWLGSR